jgi:hypothetical protein
VLRKINPNHPIIKQRRPVDNTITRRLKEGYRVLVVSYGDHDLYSGLGTPYPNNPKGGEVNGLQASMAAVEYTVANYPTTHVFTHGTSAGSFGAYALGFAFAQEGIKLNGQGRRELSRCTGEDFEHVVFIPAACTTFHRDAFVAAVLLQQR